MVGVWRTNQYFVTCARYAWVTTTTSHLLYLCLIGTATLWKLDQYTELNQILLLSTEMSACTWNKNIISISNALIHKHNFLKLKFMYDLQTHFFYVGLIPYSSKFVKPLGCWFEIGCFNNKAKLGGKNLLTYLTLQLLLLYKLLIIVPISEEKSIWKFSAYIHHSVVCQLWQTCSNSNISRMNVLSMRENSLQCVPHTWNVDTGKNTAAYCTGHI